MSAEAAQRPAFPLPLLEPIRALGEWVAQPVGNRILSCAPTGEGQPVLTLPGFLGSDLSTGSIRRYLTRKNYDAYPWLLGRNEGPDTTGENGVRLDERILQIHRKTGQKVALVGWSLGGVMARNAAKRIPDKISQVITLGSPFDAGKNISSIARLFEFVSGKNPNDEQFQHIYDYNRPPPPPSVPSTAIFTKTDGIVHWSTCVESPAPNTDNIEVALASHSGLGFNAAVLFAIAERLSVPQEDWYPFDRSAQAWRMFTYPSAGHVYGK